MALPISGLPAFAETNFAGVLEKIDIPDDLKIEVFAEMPKARSIGLGKSNGVVYVGS